MNISIKTTYGVEFLLFLAKENNNEYVKINEVAASENISIKYLENIVSTIKSAGFISVKRGAQGGYKLSKEPKEIILRDVFEALEGPVLLSENQNDTIISNVVADLWTNLQNEIVEYLGSKTLADLLSECKNRREEKGQMFYI